MALITATSIVAAGVAPNLVAANLTDTIVGDDQTYLHVNNASGGAITVTLSDGGVTPGGNVALTVARSVPAGAARLFPVSSRLNDPVTGLVTITYSAVTSVTAGAFRV